MAKQIIEQITDDLDGTDGAENVMFSLRRDTWEIDLSPQNMEKLEKALAPFITKARIVRDERVSRGERRLNVRSKTAAMSREQSADIRKWAKGQGMPVSERGRIASTIVEKYEAAH